MPPEIELLLCCARTRLDSPRVAQLFQLMRSPLDWPSLLAAARWHSITPLLYWQLKTHCPQEVPAEIFATLEAEFDTNLQQNFFLTAQLLKILKKFQQHEIAAVPFKGSVLAATLYQNLGLRRFHDIDLLIDRRDFFFAQQILEECGYRVKLPLSRHQQQLRLNTNYEQDFICDELQVNIDLHWGIAPHFFSLNLPVQELLQTTETIDLAGTKVFILSPENSLIILCVNGLKEGWSSLQRICDIAEFIKLFSTLDWPSFFKKVRQANCLDLVLLGLSLAGELLKEPLPEEIWLELKQHPKIQTDCARVYQELFDLCPSKLSPTHLAYFGWNLQSSYAQKLSYFLKIALPINERDLEFVSLPPILFPLYYPIRCWRLISKYALTGDRKLFVPRKENKL